MCGSYFNTKEIYCFKVRALKRFLCKALVQHDFVIDQRFLLTLTLKETNPAEKVISSTIQANINLYMFQAEFVVKRLFFTSAWFLILANFFPA